MRPGPQCQALQVAAARGPGVMQLASASWDATVRLWDAATGEPCAVLPHNSYVWGLAFSPDGSWLATGCSQDDRLRIWEVATARIRKEIPGPRGDRTSLAVNPDGTRLAATVYDSKTQQRSVAVHDIASGVTTTRWLRSCFVIH